MRLRIDPGLFACHPGTLIGIAVARELDNGGDDPAVGALLREEQSRVRRELAGKALAEHPRIAPWRAAYRSFGAVPKKHLSSVEALLRRVLAGEDAGRPELEIDSPSR